MNKKKNVVRGLQIREAGRSERSRRDNTEAVYSARGVEQGSDAAGGDQAR